MLIRQYTETDWPRLCAIHDAARLHELLLSGADAAFRTLDETAASERLFDAQLAVAEVDEVVQGFAAWSESELTWLYVAPDAARRGVGRALLRHAIAHAAPRFTTEVLEGNTPALQLYLAEGFHVVRRMTGSITGCPGVAAAGFELVRGHDPLRAIALPSLAHTLDRADHLLERGARWAAVQRIDERELLLRRLAPDMFNLSQQVQVLAEGIDGAVAHLAGDEAAVTLGAVFNRGDEALLAPTDASLEAARARLSAPRRRIESIGALTPLRAADETIVVRRTGHARRFVIDDFIWRYVQPNAGFHLTMIHALLRSSGVPLGKADFEGARCWTPDDD
jgi:GNAT superfamily N-acetyltransferase